MQRLGGFRIAICRLLIVSISGPALLKMYGQAGQAGQTPYVSQFSSLAAAIGAIKNGATLIVPPGRYTLSSAITIPISNFTLDIQPGASIQAGADGITLLNITGSNILVNCNGGSDSFDGQYSRSSHVIATAILFNGGTNNRVTGCGFRDIVTAVGANSGAAVFVTKGATAVVDHSSFTNIGTRLTLNANQGLWCYRCASLQSEYNVFTDIPGDNAIKFSGGAPYNMASLSSSYDIFVNVTGFAAVEAQTDTTAVYKISHATYKVTSAPNANELDFVSLQSYGKGSGVSIGQAGDSCEVDNSTWDNETPATTAGIGVEIFCSRFDIHDNVQTGRNWSTWTLDGAGSVHHNRLIGSAGGFVAGNNVFTPQGFWHITDNELLGLGGCSSHGAGTCITSTYTNYLTLISAPGPYYDIERNYMTRQPGAWAFDSSKVIFQFMVLAAPDMGSHLPVTKVNSNVMDLQAPTTGFAGFQGVWYVTSNYLNGDSIFDGNTFENDGTAANGTAYFTPGGINGNNQRHINETYINLQSINNNSPFQSIRFSNNLSLAGNGASPGTDWTVANNPGLLVGHGQLQGGTCVPFTVGMSVPVADAAGAILGMTVVGGGQNPVTVRCSWAAVASTTATLSTSSTMVTVANGTGIAVNQPVSGVGIPAGTVVSTISGNLVVLSKTPTIAGAGVAVIFHAGWIIASAP